jgi:hypothetical protein
MASVLIKQNLKIKKLKTIIMEQTTLQQRIEERAKQNLLKDLLNASNDENVIMQKFGRDNYRPQIEANVHYNEIRLYNEYTKQLFEKLLPKYITMVTDEILQKIDEIDYLVNNKESVEDY